MAAIAATAWLDAAEVANAAVVIELKEHALQSAIVLPLGDVADIGAEDVALQTALRAMPLPGKGKVGDTVSYTRAEIVRLIAALNPDWPAQLRWAGAARVLVQRRGVAIAPQEYIGWARERLQQHWAARSGRIELKPINDYRPLLVPSGRRTVEARFDGDAVRRTTRVWLDIAVDGRHYGSAVVVFDVRWLHPALVLKQRGAARQTIIADMVTGADVDISLSNGALVEDVQHLMGKRLRRDTEAGVALSADDIEDKPAVELGDNVRVFAKVGRVVVQTVAVAQRDAAIGQRVEVKNMQNNELLTVDVIGENRAVVSDKQLSDKPFSEKRPGDILFRESNDKQINNKQVGRK